MRTYDNLNKNKSNIQLGVCRSVVCFCSQSQSESRPQSTSFNYCQQQMTTNRATTTTTINLNHIDCLWLWSSAAGGDLANRLQ